MGRIRKLIVRTMVLVLIGIFFFPMLNFSVTVQAAETYNYITQWGSYGSGDSQFVFPIGVAVDSIGNVYVVDNENYRVQKFTSSGVFLTKWGNYGSGNGQFINPIGVAVDNTDNVYVVDSSGNCVQKFTSSGVFLTKWGSSGSNNGQFESPIGVAVDSIGKVYVVENGNNRVQKFTSSGDFITKWGNYGSGDGQFGNPQSVAVDNTDNVYVVDNENYRVQKFTSSGVFLTKWGSSGSGNGQFINPIGVAVDNTDNVYVVDNENYRVQKFTSSGVFLTKWGSSGSGNGQFIYPFGVAVDRVGFVYVTDLDNSCVQKFSTQDPPPSIAWSQTYSGSGYDIVHSMIQTTDGGYALVGSTDVSNPTQGTIGRTIWLLRTDSIGNKLWDRTYLGELSFTDPFSITNTSDGGYLIACGTSITGGWASELWIIKTDSSGNVLWNKTYGGIGNALTYFAIQTNDGGYALIGSVYSNNYDVWFAKINSNGNMLWSKTYGSEYSTELAGSFVQNSDGGYTIAGSISTGSNDTWVFRTDLNGNILWNKTYGEIRGGYYNRLIQTNDGGYALLGSISDSYSMWGALLKIDNNGNSQWTQTFVGLLRNQYMNFSYGYWGQEFSLSETQDGGFAIMGRGDDTNYVLIRTDSTGTILWFQTYLQDLLNKQVITMISTNDGGYAFTGWVADNYGNMQTFLRKTNPEQGTSIKPVLQIGNVVVGNPSSSAWNCKVTDSATGTVISQFTLPAAGTSGSYTNTIELNSAGSYVVFEEPKLGYHTSMQIDGLVVDSFQSTVNVDAGGNLQVVFTNTALPPGSLELPPPSDMKFSIPPMALVPIQAAWNPDANKDGRLDMVFNKTMAVIVNFTAPVNPSDIVTFSVRFDQEVFTKTGYGAILRADQVVSFCPITPKNPGNKELSGIYQINNGAPIAFPSLTVAVKETVKLPLYYAYFTKSNYGTLSQSAYAQMATDSTDFINVTYPVTNIPVNLNYNSLAGNATLANYGGAKRDCMYLASYAKTHSGENTNVIGIAIEPATYFSYHGFPSGSSGYAPNQNVKGVVVLDGGYTEAAHEVAHASYGLYSGLVPEYYLIPGLSGTIISGVCPERNQWKTGLDIMDYSSVSGNNWVGKITYDYLFNYTRKTLTDPEILIASGMIYKNGTVDLVTKWYNVAQGTPDIIAPGNYALQFLAANGTVLGSISFDASPLDADGTPFCFATTYPPGTAEVKVLNMADQSGFPKTLATVEAEEIVKINNGITFTETGLPLGTSWSVTLGSRTLSSTNATISFRGLASGTYNWNSSVTISGSTGVRYAASISSGTVDVIGNVSKNVSYITQYQVSFGVSPQDGGNIIPESSNYYDVGSGVSVSAAANDQYQFLSWSSSSPSIVFSNAPSTSTTATVNGPGIVTAAFASILGNSIAFTETGLPSGKSWSVTVGGQTLSSTSGAIVFTGLDSGSYSWSTSTIIPGSTGVRYAASISSGTVNVAGQISEAITYTTQYQVSFAMNTAGAGTINPTTTTYYNAGTKVPITATPKSGYNFWSWTATPISATYFQSNSSSSTTATINGPVTITANFAYVVTGNRNLVFTGTNNVILVTSGNNVIDCRKAPVTTVIKTGSGNNLIYLGEGDNLVKETANGNDIITSGNGNNNIDITGQGNYQITTGNGNDIIRVNGNGNCIIKTGNGNNQITILGNGNNQITAGSGSDVIVAGDGNNIIKAGAGDNKVTLGKSNNQVTTGTGSDEVTTGNGNNSIQTGGGDDKITVGSGNNYVDGGADYDICVHRTGKNTILNCEKGIIVTK